MNNMYDVNYIPLVDKTFKVYPIQICPSCTKNKTQYQMATSNDGNKHQKCMNCGWEWKCKSV